MFLLRSFPILADTPGNAAFRRFFYARWGKENCLISARERRGEYPLYTQRLSIKAAWGGSERYYMDGRTAAVDDDTYLILNDLREYGSVLESPLPVHSFSIFFRPGLAEEALAALLTPADRLLEHGTDARGRPVEFDESLRSHDAIVTPLLRFIANHVDRGVEDAMWYEEQLSFLLERMLRAHRGRVSAALSLGAVRRSTRLETYKRIAWSTDHIHTHYARPLTMDRLAEAARLSKFHFIRLFRLVHGTTPYAYLQRKRAGVASRLLDSTTFTHDDIARRVGFDHRATLYRQLVRWTGHGGRALRRRARAGSMIAAHRSERGESWTGNSSSAGS